MKFLRFFMFNAFVRAYLNSNYWFLQWNRRIKSIVLEMWYTLSMFFPYAAILLFLKMAFGDSLSAKFGWGDLLTLITFNLMMITLFNKDFFDGQSPVHRKLGFKVLDVKTNGTANKIQCMLRNLTAPIWPIEAVFILINPQRRLGDIIAGTILVDVPASDPELILTEIEAFKFDRQTIMTLFVSVICVAIFMVIFDPRIKLL